MRCVDGGTGGTSRTYRHAALLSSPRAGSVLAVRLLPEHVYDAKPRCRARSSLARLQRFRRPLTELPGVLAGESAKVCEPPTKRGLGHGGVGPRSLEFGTHLDQPNPARQRHRRQPEFAADDAVQGPLAQPRLQREPRDRRRLVHRIHHEGERPVRRRGRRRTFGQRQPPMRLAYPVPGRGLTSRDEVALEPARPPPRVSTGFTLGDAGSNAGGRIGEQAVTMCEPPSGGPGAAVRLSGLFRDR